MNEGQIKSIRFFLGRPGMFITALGQTQTVAFVHGLQWGDKSILLTEKLSGLLSKKYKITMTALGSPQQIDVFAKENNVDGFSAFKS
jgi:hypothetical protein